MNTENICIAQAQAARSQRLHFFKELMEQAWHARGCDLCITASSTHLQYIW